MAPPPPPPAPPVAVLVNSCAAFWPRTSEGVLGSLRAAGVPPEHVFVVVGQSPDPPDDDPGQQYPVTVSRVAYANMDENALLWAVTPAGRAALAGFDWAFYMHDTCTALPGFGAALEPALADALAAQPRELLDRDAAVKLHGPFSMCMGYYRLEALWRAAPALLSHANLDPARLMDVKRAVEDRAFGVLEALGGRVAVLNNAHAPGPPADAYGTGVPRVTERWASPGLLKHKANWRTFDRLDL
jgi:hypothetical protein